ncbi:histidine kinase N-terminal 7TM domain-containing diguanylate cyclase [Clostridium beijerinckii]|uniref:histidine kinase N-terminal 7TM domain-containing diguanylate cyclase n=1 Tax=Clostridium beijerinckii TaxID=1520 RepID=UPI00098CC5B3|nr:histidine kinase N-terminal 7TM domain-containing protein [Clostridium beijerinckii]OOM47932.1 phytochrome-like protein cph2 [Clostridium beijerinckii]
MFLKLNIFFCLILLLSTLTLMYIGYSSWKRDKSYVSMSLIPVSIYALGYGFEILCTSIEGVEFWIKIEYLGIPFIAVFWLMLALNFTGYKDKFKKNTLALLYIIPSITFILNCTNDFHHLFYKELYMNDTGVFPIAKIIEGPWYWIHIAYTYILMIAGLVFLVAAYLKSAAIIRKQILLIIVAWVIPWGANIIYILKLLPFTLDLSPFTLSFSGIIYSFAILKFKFLELTPIALNKVFSSMLEGVIILDSENNIVNFNDSAKNIILELRDIGKGEHKIDEVCRKYKTLLNVIKNGSSNESLMSISYEEKLKYYKININNISENNGKIVGKILILTDITEIEVQRKKVYDNAKFLQTLIDAIPNPIYSKDEFGVYNHCNAAFTEFLGMSKEEFLGSTVYNIFEKELAEVYSNSDKNIMSQKQSQAYEERLTHKDGTYHDVIFNKSVVVNEDDNVKGLVGVIIDTTEQKKSKEKISKLLKLKESMLKIGYSINEISNINNLLQLILDEVINCIDSRSCGSVLLLDKDKSLKIAVAKGYNLEDIKTFELKYEEHFAWANQRNNVDTTTIFNDIHKIENIKMLDTAEGMKIKSIISSPIIIDSELYGFLNIDSIYNNCFNEGDLELMEYMRNQVSVAITNHKLHERTLYLSRYDKLTNVCNRTWFEQLIHSEIYNEDKNIEEFFLVVFDLNDLKLVNDNYGHLAGDELIKEFSKGLNALAGEGDIIGRFGGDEFVGIFLNSDLVSLTNKLEELIRKFKDCPLVFEGNKIVCSYSYGIANFPREGIEFDELIKRADRRMYEYKRKVKSKRALLIGV